MSDRLRLVLAVVAGILLGGVVNMAIVMIGPMVIPPPPGADMFAEDNYPSASQCAVCHKQIYKEWASSNHAYASISPMFHKFEQRINDRMKDAMRAKDALTKDLMRMIKSKVTELITSKGYSGDGGDAMWLGVIEAYVKASQKTLAEYEALGAEGAEHAAQVRLPKGMQPLVTAGPQHLGKCGCQFPRRGRDIAHCLQCLRRAMLPPSCALLIQVAHESIKVQFYLHRRFPFKVCLASEPAP